MFNLVTVLLIFPAILSLDLYRREAKRLDILCCLYMPCADQVTPLSPNELSDAAAPPPPPAATASTRFTTTVQSFTECDREGQHIVTILHSTSQISNSSPATTSCPRSQSQGTFSLLLPFLRNPQSRSHPPPQPPQTPLAPSSSPPAPAPHATSSPRWRSPSLGRS